MELSRIGANRKEIRATAFENREPIISSDSSTGEITLLIRNGKGLGASGNYDYTTKLSASDIMRIIKHISDQRFAFEPGEMQTALMQASQSLLRLLIGSSGIPIQFPLSPEQIQLQKLNEKLKARPTDR